MLKLSQASTTMPEVDNGFSFRDPYEPAQRLGAEL